MHTMLLLLQTHDGAEKLNAVLERISSQLTLRCSCLFSSKLIANGELACGDRRTNSIIIRGNLIGLDNTSAALLHSRLQQWVDSSPKINVTGVFLDILPCSTYLKSEAPCETRVGGVPLYVGAVGGVVIIIIIIIVVVVAVVCRKMKR